MAHGVPHIGEQRFELGSAECGHRLRNREEPGIAHLEYVAYCHGS